MPLPTTVISDVGRPGHNPPHKSSAGNFYSIVIDNTNFDMEVWKATDPTDSWTEQDSANKPGVGSSPDRILFLTSLQDDDDLIHIAFVFDTGIGTIEIRYSQFDMAADAWNDVTTGGAKSHIIEAPPAGDRPAEWWISIAVRGTGDPIVVAYNGETDRVMGGDKQRVDYNLRSNKTDTGTWGGPVGLDVGGDVHYGAPNVHKSPSDDRINFVWLRQSNTTDPPVDWEYPQVRCITDADVLSGVTSSIGSTTDRAWAGLVGHPNDVAYNNGSVDRVVVLVVDPGNANWLHTDRIDEDSTDRWTNSVEQTENDSPDGRLNLEVAVASLVQDTGDDAFYVLYGDDTDSDLYFTKSEDDGASWGAPTEHRDGVTINFISAKVYDNGGTVLAMLYDDAGTMKYDEIDIGGAPSNDMAATSTLVASEAAAINAPGNMSDDSPLDFTAVADIGSRGVLLATNLLAFSETADVFAVGVLSATSIIQFAKLNAILNALGSLSAGSPIDFAAIADIKAFGQLLATGTLIFAEAGVDLGDGLTGDMASTSAIAFGEVADISALAELLATSTLVFAQTADLNAIGAMLATGTLIISEVADIAATANMLATSSLLFSETADATAIAALLATGTLVFGSNADINALGKMLSTSLALFTETADLKGPAQLLSTSLALFTETADLRAPAANDMSALSNLLLEAFPGLTAVGGLAALDVMSFSEAPDLTALGALQALSATVFSEAAGINAPVGIASSSLLEFGESGAALRALSELLAISDVAFNKTSVALTALGALQALSPTVFSETAGLKAVAELLATSIALFTEAAALTSSAASDMSALSSLLLEATPNLNAIGALAASDVVSFSELLGLTASGELTALSALLTSESASVISVGSLATTDLLIFSEAGDLKAVANIVADAALIFDAASADLRDPGAAIVEAFLSGRRHIAPFFN